MENDNDNLNIMNKEILRIKQDFFKNLVNYKEYIRKCETDAPLEVLCLPKNIMVILNRSGFTRVSEIAGHDLTKIKGLGSVKIAYINARLKQFLSS